MSMYRRAHAGFDYELWLRRGHTGTPDDFLEWLRGDKGDPGEPGSVDVVNLTENAKAELSSYFLPIANERHYGSKRWSTVCNIQGMCSYVQGNNDYVVFATQHKDVNTVLYRYYVQGDTLSSKPVDAGNGTLNQARQGHFNDMTYCTEDGFIYIANYTFPRIEVYDTALNFKKAIDMSGFGRDHAGLHKNNDLSQPAEYAPGCVHSIAWSTQEKCFYVGFRDLSGAGGTGGLYRFHYNAASPFSTYDRIDIDYSNYARQCMHVDSDTGNIIQVKFRQDSSFRFPYGNRAQVYSTEGKLIASTYFDSIFEIEGICELSDGLYFIAYATNNTSLTGAALNTTVFTRAAVRSNQNAGIFSTWTKTLVNSNDYVSRTNNQYYAEGGDGIAEDGGDPAAETPGKPYKTWPAIYNGLRSNHTKQLNIYLLTDMSWAISLNSFTGTINFNGGTNKYAVPVRELTANKQSIVFTNATISTPVPTEQQPTTQWLDNNLIQFNQCDMTNVWNIDLLRTRLVRLDQPSTYGTGTRFSGVGTTFRIYGDTTAEEQYALRGQTSATPNVAGSAITAISQFRMNMNFTVSAANSANYTDLPAGVAGNAFTGRAEVLSNDGMRYTLERDCVTWQRVVRFGVNASDGGKTTAIIADSGWSEPIGNKPIKILGIGNSHTRDALMYVYEILSRAGYNPVVGHFFWGGSSLAMQYNALINNVWPGIPAGKTMATEYYRKYDASGLIKYHRHGDDHNHKLDYALTDEKWDVVIFQNSSSHSIDYDNFFDYDNAFGYTHDGEPLAFTINKFIDEVKTRIGNPNLKIGIAPPPPRPYDYVETIGAYDPSDPTAEPLGGVTSMVGLLPSETAQMTEDVLYRVANDMSQCDFVINTAKGILLARGNEHLDALGHDMMRGVATPNEHLSSGVPFFLSAMMYAMTICGDEVAYGTWYPDPGEYDPETAKYSVGNVMLYDGKVYRCVSAPPYPAGEFDSQYWEEYNQAELAFLAKQYAKKAILPSEDFNETRFVRSSGFYITPTSRKGYTDANDFLANRVYELFSTITAEHIANLPVYGELAYVLTLSYDASSYSMQIYMGTSTFATRIKASNGWRAWTIYTKKSDYDALEARVAALEGS